MPRRGIGWQGKSTLEYIGDGNCTGGHLSLMEDQVGFPPEGWANMGSQSLAAVRRPTGKGGRCGVSQPELGEEIIPVKEKTDVGCWNSV